MINLVQDFSVPQSSNNGLLALMSTVSFIISSSDKSKMEIGRYLDGSLVNLVVTMVGVVVDCTSPGSVVEELETMMMA